jgi:hypothetical protein
MFLLFIIGIPVAILAFLTHFRNNRRENRFAFFFAGYTQKTRLWTAVICLRKTLLILVLGLLGSCEAIIQILSAMVVLYMFLEWQVRIGPFEQGFHNKLEAFSIFFQLALICFSFYFLSSLDINDTVLTVLSSIILSMVLGFIVACLCVLLVQALQKRILNAVQPAVSTGTVMSPSRLVAPPPSNTSSIMLSFQDQQ